MECHAEPARSVSIFKFYFTNTVLHSLLSRWKVWGVMHPYPVALFYQIAFSVMWSYLVSLAFKFIRLLGEEKEKEVGLLLSHGDLTLWYFVRPTVKESEAVFGHRLSDFQSMFAQSKRHWFSFLILFLSLWCFPFFWFWGRSRQVGKGNTELKSNLRCLVPLRSYSELGRSGFCTLLPLEGITVRLICLGKLFVLHFLSWFQCQKHSFLPTS